MLIGYERLRGVVGAGSYDELQRSHRGSIEDYLGNGEKSRHDEWSKSIAVGSRSFVETLKHFLGIRAKGRDVVEGGQGYQLREAAADYKPLLEDENEDIGLVNAYFRDLNGE